MINMMVILIILIIIFTIIIIIMMVILILVILTVILSTPGENKSCWSPSDARVCSCFAQRVLGATAGIVIVIIHLLMII